MTYTAPKFPAGLRPGGRRPSAKPLQRALKAAGYMNRLVILSDNYGRLTEAAVKRFHKKHPQYGRSTDGWIGPKGWAHLHSEAYGGAHKAPPTVADPEPAHDYRRVSYGGRTVNVRTRTMLEDARKLLTEYEWNPRLTQGSYNRGVSASAGTHDGGGVVDIAVHTMTPTGRDYCVKALRKAGFAAWLRSPSEGFVYHIHAVAIGDREMASGARNQVAAYFRGRNGLANGGPDSAPSSVGRPYPAWAAKYR